MMTALRLAGVLDGCAGLILGQFRDCGEGPGIENALRRSLEGFDGPVVINFPIGHGSRNLALPIGPRARLDADALRLDLLEPCLA